MKRQHLIDEINERPDIDAAPPRVTKWFEQAHLCAGILIIAWACITALHLVLCGIRELTALREEASEPEAWRATPLGPVEAGHRGHPRSTRDCHCLNPVCSFGAFLLAVNR